jgi:hypothetical protein
MVFTLKEHRRIGLRIKLTRPLCVYFVDDNYYSIHYVGRSQKICEHCRQQQY